MTRAREAALACLEASREPLSAAGVLSAIDMACDQATVYRALHYLEDRGLAESFVLHCDEHGTERYYTARTAPHRHWFHCRSCHRFVDLGECRLGDMLRDLERHRGLTVTTHTLYLTGTCADCSARAGPGSDGAVHRKGA